MKSDEIRELAGVFDTPDWQDGLLPDQVAKVLNAMADLVEAVKLETAMCGNDEMIDLREAITTIEEL